MAAAPQIPNSSKVMTYDDLVTLFQNAMHDNAALKAIKYVRENNTIENLGKLLEKVLAKSQENPIDKILAGLLPAIIKGKESLPDMERAVEVGCKDLDAGIKIARSMPEEFKRKTFKGIILGICQNSPLQSPGNIIKIKEILREVDPSDLLELTIKVMGLQMIHQGVQNLNAALHLANSHAKK